MLEHSAILNWYLCCPARRARLHFNAAPEPERVETSLEPKEAPLANTGRYDSLRDTALLKM